MPITCYEMYNSRSFTAGKDTISGKLEYVCHGTSNDVVAKAAISAVAPFNYPGIAGLVLQDINTRPLGGLLFYGTVDYAPDDAPLFPAVGLGGAPLPVPIPAPTVATPLGADFAFDLSAQTEKVTQSLQTIGKFRRGPGVAPDNKGAIGLAGDGEVKGCDRIKPYLEWSTSKTFASVTMAYIFALSELVGTTNNAPFYGGDTGTQLFLGASGNTKDINKCVVTFKFAHQKHRTSIPICDGLTVPSKKAWEYLWIAYRDTDDPDANKLVQQPDAAYVEKIYEEGNYATMGIG